MTVCVLLQGRSSRAPVRGVGGPGGGGGMLASLHALPASENTGYYALLRFLSVLLMKLNSHGPEGNSEWCLQIVFSILAF